MVPFFLFYLQIRLSLVYPAIVVENVGGIRGLTRSWELTEGGFCDVWCSNLLMSVFFWAVLYAAYKLFEVAAEHTNENFVVFLAVVIASLPNFFFSPCGAV